ncbi:hypothetical protein [Streptomyces sp. H39-S7]|uniref:hypothetical protein n=1 Tax=Streptomyces sp. H39-S7 TaxID=3004357 RepID=UPI0022AF837A|nr:hypothetical protein [Streptomyces sp. H39-S7]MCZ4118594.1 hypothetical protein [Streptomyces sp. H39-S7]
MARVNAALEDTRREESERRRRTGLNLARVGAVGPFGSVCLTIILTAAVSVNWDLTRSARKDILIWLVGSVIVIGTVATCYAIFKWRAPQDRDSDFGFTVYFGAVFAAGSGFMTGNPAIMALPLLPPLALWFTTMRERRTAAAAAAAAAAVPGTGASDES